MNFLKRLFKIDRAVDPFQEFMDTLDASKTAIREVKEEVTVDYIPHRQAWRARGYGQELWSDTIITAYQAEMVLKP